MILKNFNSQHFKGWSNFPLSTVTTVLIFLITFLFSAAAQTKYGEGSESGIIRFKKSTMVSVEKLIVFGDKLGIGELPEGATWSITTSEGDTLTGNGNSLNDYIFSIPGAYKIYIDENQVYLPGSCSHKQFPDIIDLTVSDVKMTFHLDEVSFSGEIHKGVQCQSLSVTVPVTVEPYDNETSLDFPFEIVATAGVGTTVVGTLHPGTVVYRGKQNLIYNLSGTVDAESYIMFDFMDINGQVQSYSMTSPIK
ncbi:MAG: hypothetical protein IPN29_04830 [Saprospiraceae bacterium]|nr:hypothetical protein [Saprospiraceae bacterium]